MSGPTAHSKPNLRMVERRTLRRSVTSCRNCSLDGRWVDKAQQSRHRRAIVVNGCRLTPPILDLGSRTRVTWRESSDVRVWPAAYGGAEQCEK